MAMINGFGTTYLGVSDKEKDGSFVTTEWSMAFFVPISSNKSYRVIHQGEKYNYYVVGSSTKTKYKIISEVPEHKKQVNKVRLFQIIGLSLFILFTIISSLVQRAEQRQDTITLGFILCIAFLIIPSYIYSPSENDSKTDSNL